MQRTTLAVALLALLFAVSCADEDLPENVNWEGPIIKHEPCDPELLICLVIPAEDTPVEDTPVEDTGWRPGSDDTSTTATPDTPAAPWVSCGATKQAWLADNEGTAWVTPNALTDDDGDGIQYSDERYYGTDPDNADTDGDGIDDGDECRWGTNPLEANGPPMTCCARPPMATDPDSGLRSPDYGTLEELKTGAERDGA